MKNIIFIFSILFFFACGNPVGDQKSAIGSVDEIGNTSFVNKNFKGNLINFSTDMNPCQNLGKEIFAKLYNVPSEEVYVIEGSKTNQTCSFKILLGGNDFNSLTGGISAKADNNQNEIGTWEERWSIQKATSKSSEYLPNMGKAAIWKGSSRSLRIKFEGYTLEVIAPGASFNEEEKKRNRDYKAIAIEMAKIAGFIK